MYIFIKLTVKYYLEFHILIIILSIWREIKLININMEVRANFGQANNVVKNPDTKTIQAFRQQRKIDNAVHDIHKSCKV